MTPQESQALQDFLGQLTQVRGIQKDPEAEAAINRAVAQQPDAAYLLVQRALLQDRALDSAKARIEQLRNERQRTSAVGSFLDAGSAWGRSAASAPHPEAQSPLMQAAPARMPMYGSQARAARPGLFGGGGGGSFLGTLAATAAGVAGGAFLFQGIQSLLNHDEQGAAGSDEQAAAGDAATEPAGLSDQSSMDADSAAYDDTGFNDMDFGGGDDGTAI